jgi:ethanolamine utilization protein EutA
MKKYILAIAITVILLIGCQGNSKNNNEHTHEDGTVHQHDQDTAHNQQEEFTIGKDSSHHEHDHQHDHEHEHTH